MKKENIFDMKNAMYQQIQTFELYLLDTKSLEEAKLKKLSNNIHKVVDEFVKQGVEDINLWVFLKYRDGKVMSKKSRVINVEPKTLLEAIEQGFEIPETASIVEFEIKPVWENGYNRFVEPNSIYEIKFGLNNGEELTVEQLKRRYKLTPRDNLYSVEDMKNSKILRFTKKKKQNKNVETGLGCGV